MAADTYDPILGIILQGTGNNNNAWGTTFNNSAAIPLARAIAGVNTINQVGGTLDLSIVTPPAGLRQDVDRIQLLTATLTSDLTIQVVNLPKVWKFWNRTSGAFNVYVKVPGGLAATGPASPGGLVHIPQGLCVDVICDGAGILRRGDDQDIGSFQSLGTSTSPAGQVQCNGASYLRTQMPDLFAKIGTTWGSSDGLHFNVPDFVTNGRFLRAAGGFVDSVTLTVGLFQNSQNQAHTHVITGTPGVGSLGTDVQGNHSHTINVNDPSHGHSSSNLFQTNPGNIGGGGSFGLQVTGNVNSAFTGITASAVSAGAHAHNITGAPSVGTLGTSSNGGGEARPSSVAVLMCIKY